jgi:acyl-coenzyme A synthetase/AMP-(fatty) acid ligase
MSYFDECGKFGERLAFVDECGIQMTYAQLEENSQAMGQVLTPRSLVFQLCENTIGSAAGYVAFLSNQVVPLMLDAKIDKQLLADLLAVYRPRYIHVPDHLAENFKGKSILWQRWGYTLFQLEEEQVYPLNDQLALLLTTSGSTGSPKLVRQSYTNIQTNAQSIAQYLELDETERPVTTLPMNYTYGLSIINSHLLVGATILLTTKSIMSRDFWMFMKEEKATSFGGVPFTYEMLKRVRFFRMKLPDLRTFTQAGGKLAPELHREFAEYAQANGKRFVVMYGQTEATARMSYLPPERSLEKYGSIGIAIPGGKLELIDVNGQPITEPDVVGEMMFHGPNVTLGYAEKGEDLALGDERHGTLITGDMAKMDADGYFFVVGRKKRFLKLFGNRVNLDETDRLVKRQFPDLDCASTGTDEKLRIYITDESKLDEVKHFLADTTHLNLSAFEARYIPEIPKNEAGKTLYKELP